MPKAMVLKTTGSTDNFEMREYPEPKAIPGTTIAEVSMCGVCGTDTHMVYGRLPVKMPHILGHEWFGTVKELGEGVETDFTGKPLEEGDKFTCCLGICNKCWFCLNVPARQSLCQAMEVVGISAHSCDEPPHFWGAYSERVFLQEQMPLFKIPDGLSEKEMVLTEPLAVATRAFKRLQAGGTSSAAYGEGVDPSQTLVIQGAGPIGLCHVTTANVYGMENIIVIDSIPARLEQAKKMGAKYTIDMNDFPTLDDRVEETLEITYGIGADGVIEATGVPAAFSEAFKHVRRGGTVVEMGHFTDTGETKVNPHVDFCNKEVDCFGDWGYSPFEYRTTLAVMAKAKKMGIPFEDIVTDVQPLYDLPNQILRQERKEAPGKIAIDCRITE